MQTESEASTHHADGSVENEEHQVTRRLGRPCPVEMAGAANTTPARQRPAPGPTVSTRVAPWRASNGIQKPAAWLEQLTALAECEKWVTETAERFGLLLEPFKDALLDALSLGGSGYPDHPMLLRHAGREVHIEPKALVDAKHTHRLSKKLAEALDASEGGFWNEAQRVKRSGFGRLCQAP
jgi:hypothetical protein